MKTHIIKSALIALPICSATAINADVNDPPLNIGPPVVISSSLQITKDFVSETAFSVAQNFFNSNVKPKRMTALKQRVSELETQLADYQKISNSPPTKEFNDLKAMVENLKGVINVMDERLAKGDEVDSSEEGMKKVEIALAGLRELRKMLLTTPRTQNIRVDELGPVDFKVNHIYRSQGKGDFKELTDGSTFKIGDHYKIIFTPAEDCFVYIFNADSGDGLHQLFPVRNFDKIIVNYSNPIKAGETYYLPTKDRSFVLSEAGTESVHFVVTRQRDIVIEKQYQAMLSAQQQGKPARAQQLQASIIQTAKSMGERKILDNVVTDQPNVVELDYGQKFSLLQRALNDMCNGCVNTLTFSHQ